MINYKLNNKNGHVNTNEFNIDERARYGTDIDKVHLIQLGKATNYYDDWRDHPNEYIRCALARRGYHSEYYLTDTVNVRNAALYHLPEKMMNYWIYTHATIRRIMRANVSNKQHITN